MDHIKKQWFLIALAMVLLLGFLRPDWFAQAASIGALRSSIVATVLFLMALPLDTHTVWHTLRHPGPALLASTVNMGLMPLLAWALSRGLSGELAVGMLVASAAPCTLASAAVWTRRAGGNDATSILVTLLTNSTCFLTTPLWLLWTTRIDAQLNVAEMITKLGLLVVLPMAFAQLLRLNGSIAEWSTRRKRLCGTLAQTGILAMVLFGATIAKQEMSQSASGQIASPGQMAWMILLTALLHLIGLSVGYLLAGALRMPRQEQISVAIAGSQKTLMVGLYIAVNYFGGLVLLPMVSYHVGQLLLDTIIADRWAARTERSQSS